MGHVMSLLSLVIHTLKRFFLPLIFSWVNSGKNNYEEGSMNKIVLLAVVLVIVFFYFQPNVFFNLMIANRLVIIDYSWPLQYLDRRVLSLLSLRYMPVPSLGRYKLYIYNNTGG